MNETKQTQTAWFELVLSKIEERLVRASELRFKDAYEYRGIIRDIEEVEVPMLLGVLEASGDVPLDSKTCVRERLRHLGLGSHNSKTQDKISEILQLYEDTAGSSEQGAARLSLP